MLEPVTALDFETEGIDGNPLITPPRPVGLAVRWQNGQTEYETDPEKMAQVWQAATRAGPVLFHNAAFDLSVAERWLQAPPLPWQQVHDTMFLLYLHDPYAPSYSLKASGERVLGIAPDEQDACRDWVLANIPRATPKNWGYWLSEVPVAILAPYAQQDVSLTHALYTYLAPQVPQVPYNRERRLAPLLRAATVRGVRVARDKLGQAVDQYTQVLETVDNRLRTHLHAPTLNPGSSAQLGKVLYEADLLAKVVYTPTNQVSTAKKNLSVKDESLGLLLNYRSTLETMLGTFMRPWYEKSAPDSRLHPNWNSTRGDRAGGTRTGRLSSADPNFQNPPNVFEVPTTGLLEGLPALPVLRGYIQPEEGHLWLKRDFSAQEVRVMAHFEGGILAEAFRNDPTMDPHERVRDIIRGLTGVDYPRKYVKETGFGILYGMGVATLAERLGASQETAKELIKAYKTAIPGVEKLQRGTRQRGRSGQPITTWGGRKVYVEPPKLVNGSYRSFDYKMLNYLIQGSSADQTKECLLQWHQMAPGGHYFLATVHDETNISVPEDEVKEGMEILRYALEETCDFEVPMRSEGFYGPNWGELKNE